ncbi:tetratricopeptide repeat protein [Nonlabens ulvanivorans]|uniref:TPR domain protein n=1 Tax=Nonlabens ulvanivorans TaxID=906888 RepID=A0A081DA99_NONUL|nr:tetratricopeptide repeat protein [Nonlabens ulvanivorans]KEZ93044.1 hypothetical protein IL45_13020 [Nonlabens ulvanivorans]PRX12726.1 hypothetical protein LY02_02378 [Nonlabens ulvanivorans]GAK75845.1 TPR domain protein [Nonlabens ulvanivorans]GAL00327.1 TPR domain protein [Nonlabens ulvanivorans]GAL75568.1 hypothetical protein JCM19275_2019 [Nonlabens ulvanivorans]
MATYNKRGYKPKTKKEKEVVEEVLESESTTAEVFSTLDEGANKTEEWVSRNQNTILYIIGGLAVIALLWWAYTQFILGPKSEEAVAEMTQANIYYNDAIVATGDVQDSLYTLALEGGNGKFGLTRIIDEYSGTDAANLANYQAGMAYLNLGGNNYQKAIDHLTAYKGGDSVLESISLAGIGDALVQVNQTADAVSYYMQAAETNPNDFTSPKYLLKAANAALATGDKSTAIEALEKIESMYADADEASTAKVLLGQAQASGN